MRIDAFLAEKYHYTPTDIAQLTPTECLWLCVSWDSQEEDLTITEHMDPTIVRIRAARQQEIVDASIEYAQLSALDKLRLAQQGIYSQSDYIRYGR